MPRRLYFIATFFLLITSFVISTFAYTFIKRNINNAYTPSVITTIKTSMVYSQAFPKQNPLVYDWNSNDYSNSSGNRQLNNQITKASNNFIGSIDINTLLKNYQNNQIKDTNGRDGKITLPDITTVADTLFLANK